MELTNNFNLPKVFVDIVKKITYDLTESDPCRIGVTTLMNAPRVRLLTVRHWKELQEDVSDHLWRILGDAVHEVMSNVDGTHRFVEQKIEEVVDGITIVGKPDLYDDKEKSISDFKITSIWAVKLGMKEEWVHQLNCYAWLMRKAGFVIESIYINAILKDWRKSEILRYKDYPPIPYQKIEVPLWSFEEQEAYIRKRVAIYKAALTLTDENLPLCTAKERWKKEDEWAVYKNANKTATKLFDSLEAAHCFITNSTKRMIRDKYKIIKREGVDMKCQSYCLPCKFCEYYINKYQKIQKPITTI